MIVANETHEFVDDLKVKCPIVKLSQYLIVNRINFPSKCHTP